MSGIADKRKERSGSNADTSQESSGLRVGIVGATGAVGEVLIEVLAERGFPAAEIVPLASSRSAGQSISINGEPTLVREATPDAFEGIDLVFFAATGALSKGLAPEAVARGAVVIDKSSTWRMDPSVPLVVPEVNASALDEHAGIVACPNCTTIGVVMALEPIRALAGLKSVVATTFQAVSGAGREGLDELESQRGAPQAAAVARVFADAIDANVVPLCGAPARAGYTDEELKLLDETRKILALPALEVSMTCARVPVRVGHSAALLVETERRAEPAAVRSALAAAPGIRVVDDLEAGLVPTPLRVAGHDEVHVGRIRGDLAGDRIWLWQSSDNLRKGAATNAVQIAEALIARGLLGGRRSERAAS